MERNLSKMKKIISIFLAVVMALSIVACGRNQVVWDDIVMGDILPQPPTKKGKIYTNSADELWVDINNLSSKQFYDYIEACKEKGFIVDADTNSSCYDAYNAEGYKLSLSHYGENADMYIRLSSPIKMTDITWPTGSAGNQLPSPKSTTGTFSYEHDDHFFVYIGDTSKADYAEYVNSCSQKGFVVDYSKGDDFYYAYNSEGWYVDVRYEGNNVMTINIKAPKKAESTTAPPQPIETQSNTDTIDADFKAAMDSYEKFFDEYVAIMKKYKNNPTDMSVLLDYTKYVGQYADMVQKFSDWEDEELNAAELNYYIEVQARVSKKLLEVAQ